MPLLSFSPPADRQFPFEIKRIETLPKSALRPVPHRHTFYVMFWITAGSGTHYVDFVGDTIRPNSLHFVGPGQVHYWDLETELTGYAIVFEAALFVEAADQQLLEELTCFRTINGLAALTPPAANAAAIDYIVEHLAQEYSQQHYGHALSVVAWLRLLIIAAQRLANASEPSSGAISGEKLLTNRYINLVEQHATTQHKVEWYANELAVTVAHLSKSVKTAHGATAGSLLRNRLVLEAKRLLVHTDETAAAIADQLNFENASYFGRFFKRETQQTPRQFRTQTLT